MRLDQQLVGMGKCPFCSVANPTLSQVWHSGDKVPRLDGGEPSRWAAYRCTTCGHVLSAKGSPTEQAANPSVVATFPKARLAHSDIPELARAFLQQAYDTQHAPDASGIMAASAIDAMLKEHGYADGSLYARIEQAVTDGVLTKNMSEWAHHVRLGANRPRHADTDNPRLTAEEAQRAVDFAEALGNFLFVLKAQIDRAITPPAADASS